MKHTIYINQKNKNVTVETNLLSFGFEKEKTKIIRLNDLWDFKEILCGFDSLVVQPQYFNEDMIHIIQEKNIQCLYLEDRLIGGFFEKEIDKYKTLTDLSFLVKISHLKCFKMDAYTPFFSEKPISKIEDYTPIENLKELEYIYIPDNGDYPVLVDIDFSKLKKLKEVNLPYPKKNKTIYRCENIESIETRYYEKDLIVMENWKKLKYFSAYCTKLESFKGLSSFNKLEILKVEITSKFKSFENTNSQSLKTFFVYTEAKKTSTTLNGLSGLKNVEKISLNGLKMLEDISDLSYCITLNELVFENCKIPNDVSTYSSLINLKKLIFDDCKDIESLEFVKTLSKLRYLSFSGNTKIIDGNLDFLLELSRKGVEIYFNDRKHYSVKYKDIK